jgi:uncharacterized protein YeaO (DUF488 family)
MTFRIKRVYEHATTDDGIRVLVDRLWPRGVRKADASLALWMKDVAPSAALRRWFDHDPERFAEFSRRYRKELAGSGALTELRKLGQHKLVTLVYAARDRVVNHACVLQAMLTTRPPIRSTGARNKSVRVRKKRNASAGGRT